LRAVFPETALVETAYAKINLALHVRARRGDGYHEIETLFAFAEDGDGLRAVPAADVTLTIVGDFAKGLSNGSDNLVLRAAEALRSAYGVKAGAAITLDKRLPVAAGIGGGSADAAAALHLLTRLWDLPDDLNRLLALAAPLGADVPACVMSQTLRGKGVGDDLALVGKGALTGMPLLLVNPGVACPTAPVFAAWDGVDRGPLAAGDALAAARAGRNDLEKPALTLVPQIAGVLETLNAQAGLIFARMSGSGATCFGLFENDAARDSAADAFADAWRLKTNLR
jgi:4-diphosphocytidyl-2-C-methyl-D-erythritol kinase